MLKVLDAVYSDGNLILKEKLGDELEGKTLQIVIEVKSDELVQTESIQVDQKARIRQFIEKWKQRPAELPEDYKFDREELYER